MPNDSKSQFNFWQELKRRRVIHVIVVYASAAFAIIELINNVYETLNLPDWTPALTLIIIAIGFPIAIIFSWIFDLTPKGIEKTKSVEVYHKGEKDLVPRSWRFATYISIVIIIGLLAFNIFGGRIGAKFDETLEKSIAVLPFYYYNSDPEAGDIGDAFANEINTQLCKIKGFDRIVSHTSTLQYKGPDKPLISTIGRELNANYIIEGSLERQDEDVSIQIKIIYSPEDDHIWAHEFKDKWNNIFTLRATIAKSVAAQLKTILKPDEIVQIEERSTKNLEAYDFFLLGNQYRIKSTEEALIKAIDLYNSAIELDPEFALAYTGLGKSYRDLFVFANWLPDEAFEQARNAAIMALEINDQLAEAHELLALIKFEYDWELKEAEKELLKAVSLNPNLASSYYRLADIQLISGHYVESHKFMKQAVILDPNSRSYSNGLGLTYFLTGQVDSAINYLQNRIIIDSSYSNTHFWLGLIYLESGEYLKSIREIEKTVSVNSISMHYRMFLGIAYAKAGMAEETRTQLKVFEELERGSRKVSFGRAALHAELGEYELAIRSLQMAYDERSQWVFYIRPYKVLFSSMRSDPRFIEIYNKIYSNIE